MEPTGAVVTGNEEHPLRHALTIGRDRANDIVIDDTTVSRRHAILLFVGDRWLLEDRGTVNGTWVNGLRVPFGAQHPLRHGDRITVGKATLAFSWPADGDDPERTDPHDQLPNLGAALSPFQRQVVRALCGAWVTDGSVDILPSNEQIAAALGTPQATGSVKAALRRIYAKAGIVEVPPHAKRRALCRAARTQGWL
jgi:hypothetical protein